MTHLAWIEPLLIRPGDRMPLEEFLERWDQMPELKFAELIDGVVYMPSPASRTHRNLDGLIQTVCGSYNARTLGTESGPNGTWLMTPSSAPQPDCSINILPEYGGRSTTRKGLLAGVPEFVAEICHSSRAYDLGPKLALYLTAGVDEYLAILVEERRFEWRTLIDGSYQLLKSEAGVFHSLVLPGLWIDSKAFWEGDSASLLDALALGLASQEHVDFVARLQRQKELHRP